MALSNDKGKSLSITAADEVKALVTNKKRQDFLHNHLADQQLTKEGMALAQLFEGIQKQRIEVRKVSKPSVGYDDEGKEVNLPRTKEQHDAKIKAEERLKKMETAFAKGYENGEMKDVFDLVQQLGSKDKGGSGENKGGETS